MRIHFKLSPVSESTIAVNVREIELISLVLYVDVNNKLMFIALSDVSAVEIHFKLR